MELSPIEHAVGVYLGLLLLACVVSICANYFTHLPYTIGLTLVGLAIGITHLGPDIQETGFGHDLIFFVMLPPLLFQGALHMQLGQLTKHLAPIVCFAIPGVVISTFLVGGIVHWLGGMEALLIAFLFGALITPTDPVSVLALFRESNVPRDLRTIVEGESLFNDATGIVLFSIILEAVIRGEGLSPGHAVLEFVTVSGGGMLLGAALGGLAFWVLRRLDKHLLENAICLVLAYGSFWLGEVLHLSGVIATVIAGLLIGNYGRRHSMSRNTIRTVETFFESIDFLINSLLFILIGLELQTLGLGGLRDHARIIVVAIVAMIAGRAAVVYPIYWLLNQTGLRRPEPWKHILLWGGLRGSIPIALILGLPRHESLEPYRAPILAAGFSCVFFSLVVQGLTMKPLIRWLGVGVETSESEPPD